MRLAKAKIAQDIVDLGFRVNRAERTPEAVAVSGLCGEGSGKVASLQSRVAAVEEGSRLTFPDNPQINFGGAGGNAPAGYLELYDNVSLWTEATCDKKGVGWFIAGECENGHRFAKELVCGKEFCGVCGKDGSIAHNRRWLRWLPKIQQIDSLGYFVFTLPEPSRAKYRTKKALSGLGHQVQELLKGFGYSRGLRRWHYFGDRSTKYHPHLNCLVDGGYMSPKKLKAINRAYASLVGVDVIDVKYRYRKSPGRMLHTLRYTCRATFRDYAWDLELALELRGFRNMVVWGRGKWNSEPSWSLDELSGKAKAEVEGLDIEAIESLAEKRCPVCGEAVVWGEALPIGLLAMVDKTPLGAGYYRLTDNKSPPVRDKYHPKYPLLGYLANIKHCRLDAAKKRAEAEAAIEAEEYQSFWADLLN